MRGPKASFANQRVHGRSVQPGAPPAQREFRLRRSAQNAAAIRGAGRRAPSDRPRGWPSHKMERRSLCYSDDPVGDRCGADSPRRHSGLCLTCSSGYGSPGSSGPVHPADAPPPRRVATQPVAPPSACATEGDNDVAGGCSVTGDGGRGAAGCLATGGRAAGCSATGGVGGGAAGCSATGGDGGGVAGVSATGGGGGGTPGSVATGGIGDGAVGAVTGVGDGEAARSAGPGGGASGGD
jgi:hypothetical protein